MGDKHTFTFSVIDGSADWIAQWLAANPVGGAAWTGRWTTGGVDFDAAGAGISGLYDMTPMGPVPPPTGETVSPTPPDHAVGHLSFHFEDYRGHDALDWDGAWNYDPVTGLHEIGGGAGSSPAYDHDSNGLWVGNGATHTWYQRYDPRTNRWTKRHNPLGIGGTHHYNESAMDRIGRKYYRRFRQFDMDNESLPFVDIEAGVGGHTSGVACKFFHEALGRLYTVESGGQLSYWTPTVRNGSTGTWSSRSASYHNAGNHQVAQYHATLQTAVFGGGNNSNRMFKVSSTGVVSEIDNVPPEIMAEEIFATGGASASQIIDCGLPDAYIVMCSLTGPARSNIWLLRPNAAPGSQWSISTDTYPSWLISQTTHSRSVCGIRHLGLVMMLRLLKSTASTTNPVLFSRVCSVAFYKPSGN